MPLTIKQLKVFRAIARHGSISNAAESLFLTKPALSMALQELEKQLNQQLFNRVNNRLHLNHQGQRLLPLANELLERAQHIEQTFRADSALGGTLNIGASNTIGDYLLPTLLGDFLTLYPACQPRVVVSNTRSLAEQLNRFELDIILIEGSLSDARLSVQNWISDEMQLVAAPHHPLAIQARKLGALSPKALKDQYWCLREPGSGAREHFDKTVTPYLGNWHLRLESQRNEVILGGCRAGQGLAYVSSFVARQSIEAGTLCRLPVDLDTARQLRVAIQKEKYLSPLLQSFMQHCFQCASPSA
jgi:DNA-binding transcriptional LysR family regulator